MGISMPPDPNWHKQKTPQEWQAIQDQAIKDHRVNIHDQDAMNAIRDSNEALNAYEQPAIEAGKHTLDSGWGNPLEAVKGEAEGGLDALLAPFHIANTVYRQGPGEAINEMVEGLKSVPGEIASGDPRRIGRVGGNVAGGIATGKMIGKMGSGVGSAVSELAERPMLKNALIKSQISSLSQNAAKSSAVMPDVIEQAGLKTDAMKQGLTKGEQQISKGAGTLDDLIKRPGLQNQLTELQIQKLRKMLDDMNDEEGDGGQPAPFDPLDPKTGPSTNPRDIAKEEFKNEDPYGLNEQTKPTDPMDQLGGAINDLKSGSVRDEAPHDILWDKNGPKPLSPEEINQLLNSLRKPPNKP